MTRVLFLNFLEKQVIICRPRREYLNFVLMVGACIFSGLFVWAEEADILFVGAFSQQKLDQWVPQNYFFN